jgi:hypothetical protein
MAGNMYVKIKKNDLARLAKACPDKADKVVRALAQEGVNIVNLSMTNSPATGRAYQRGSVTHVSSSPGKPPRPDIGTLMGSIRAEPRGAGKYAIVAGTEYAYWLEFGNTRGLAPRPFMGPMAMQLEKLVAKFFDEFLK